MSISWSSGINTAALRTYIKKTTEGGVHLRAFRMYRKGETVSATFPPFRPDEGMHLYSLSKSFTSVCVGIAQDMGLLSLQERIIDIFPEYAPENVSENLSLMTLGDVLSMQSGHSVCHLDKMRFSDNAVKTFMAMPVPYKPGTTFVYSTGGTAVCGAAVAKRSGMKLSDFMDKYLFSKLGIENRNPICCADGTHCGGTGIFISPDELYRFGLMLLHGGVYNGERIASESFLQSATVKIADNSMNGTPDWVAGYGYQFWVNARNGFRGDGAYGQLCVVLPKEDTVFILQGEVGNMQNELSDIYWLLDHVCERNPDEQKQLEQDVNSYYAPLPGPIPEQKCYMLQDNPAQIQSITILPSSDGSVALQFDTAYGKQIILAGNGKWLESNPMLRYCNPSINALDPHFGWIETHHLRSSYHLDDDGLKVVCKHTDTPHTQTIHFTDDHLSMFTYVGDLPDGVRTILYK